MNLALPGIPVPSIISLNDGISFFIFLVVVRERPEPTLLLSPIPSGPKKHLRSVTHKKKIKISSYFPWKLRVELFVCEVFSPYRKIIKEWNSIFCLIFYYSMSCYATHGASSLSFHILYTSNSLSLLIRNLTYTCSSRFSSLSLSGSLFRVPLTQETTVGPFI